MSRIIFHTPVNIIDFVKRMKKETSIREGDTTVTENFLIKHSESIKKGDFSFLDNKNPFLKMKNYKRSVYDFPEFYKSNKEDIIIRENTPSLIKHIRVSSYRLFILFLESLVEWNLQVYLKNPLFHQDFKTILEKENQREREKSQTSFINDFWNKNITILISEEPKRSLSIPKISSLKELNKYAQNDLKLSQTSQVNRQIKSSFLIKWPVEETAFKSQDVKIVNEGFQKFMNSSRPTGMNLQQDSTKLLKTENLPEKMKEYYNTIQNVIASDKDYSVDFINSRLKELKIINDKETTLSWRRHLFRPLWKDPFDGTLWDNKKIEKENLKWYKSIIVQEEIRDFFSKDTNPDRVKFWSRVAERAITERPDNLEEAQAFLLKINQREKPAGLYVIEFKQVGRAYFYDGEHFDKITKEIHDWKNENAGFFKPISSKGERKHFLELSKAVICAERHDPKWQQKFKNILIVFEISGFSKGKNPEN